MGAIRSFFKDHRALAALILALALAMKAFVPAGFMVGTSGTTLTVQICDAQGQTTLKQINLPGKPAGQTSNDHAKAARDCPFTGLSMHALSGADPVLLALALAFVVALGFLPAPPLRLARPAFLTPPLRGPPLFS